MVIISDNAVPVTDVTSFFTNDRDISINMLRLDQLHPVISGNKWFKLKYNLAAVIRSGYDQLITFGGAYSNHLIATASAAGLAGIKAIGVVRGFHAQEPLSATLQACIAHGMQLHFVSRQDYALKNEPAFLTALQSRFGAAGIIPEGGDNAYGRQGAGDIAALIPDNTTRVCLPVGTGTTFAGLRQSLTASMHLTGFTAMKGGRYLEDPIRQHLNAMQDTNWNLEDHFHFGGFAKTTAPLIGFMQQFRQETGIPLDVVYTGKMMWAIHRLLQSQAFAAGSRITAVHTGGLQGNPDGLYEV